MATSTITLKTDTTANWEKEKISFSLSFLSRILIV